jgi:hypothetical protein
MRKLFVLLALLPLAALADTATLSWTAPTQDTENRPLASDAITKYQVAWSWASIPADATAATEGVTVVDVTGATSQIIDVTVPVDGGTFYARVNACTAALCSEWSGMATKTFAPKPVIPNAPTSIVIEFR